MNFGSGAARLNSAQRWRTLQQRANPVSRAGITSRTWGELLLGCLLMGWALVSAIGQVAQTAVNAASRAAADPDRGATPEDIPGLFQRGQEALNHQQLEEAERDFRAVLALDPKSGGAYANLGVVYMRRKEWPKALEELRQAEKLMPQVAGIRLNMGLAYYRQNEFFKAIPPFESVVREQPQAAQPRYLLGLCYFFVERWADSAKTLEPLWEQESGQLPYLYVLSNAAHRAGNKEIDDRASEQLIKVGDGSPEYHLFMGKYHLNLGQNDLALADFQAAAAANPSLPFVHFNLGMTYVNKQDYAQARSEFLKDAAVEPDLALNYDELGSVYWLTQDDANAEQAYRHALRLDPRLVSSRLGLAKIYQRQKKYQQALVEIDAASRIDPARPDVHYLRGRVLLLMGHKEEAKKELAAAEHIENEAQKQTTAPVPSPELLGEQR
jgi:tetratricopeptide (TPR) repeat protein